MTFYTTYEKTYDPLKAKDCKLGVSCGGTCIAQTKSCKIGLKPQEKIKVQAAVKSLNANIPAVKPANSFFKLFKPERILAGDDAKPWESGSFALYAEYRRTMPNTYQQQFKTSKDYVNWLKTQ